MKRITRFKVENLNEYINLNLKFNDDMTLLYGMNGSGKTSALRLLVNLLAGCPLSLLNIPYSYASVQGVTHDGSAIGIESKKNENDISITVILNGRQTKWHEKTFQHLDPDDIAEYINKSFAESEVQPIIGGIESPLFLDVNRRYDRFAVLREKRRDCFKKELMFRHVALHRRNGLANKVLKDDDALSLALMLVEEELERVRRKGVGLNDSFREKIFQRSFEYASDEPKLPKKLEIPSLNKNKLNVQRSRIMKMLDGLEERSGRLHNQTNRLFLSVEETSGLFAQKVREGEEEFNHIILKSLLVQNQFAFLDSISEIAMEYFEESEKSQKSINEFFGLINSFFELINKVFETNDKEELVVTHHDREIPYGLLSSGERQILIIMAHLKFDEYLQDGGIFIVDEPELSLHVAWQEMLIDAIAKANPDIQLIFATHAPSIVAGRLKNCVELRS